MKIFSKFPTVNISKRNVWLGICIAKNLINLDNFKDDFLNIEIFFAPSDFQIVVSQTNIVISANNCPILRNHTLMESLFIQLSDDV